MALFWPTVQQKLYWKVSIFCTFRKSIKNLNTWFLVWKKVAEEKIQLLAGKDATIVLVKQSQRSLFCQSCQTILRCKLVSESSPSTNRTACWVPPRSKVLQNSFSTAQGRFSTADKPSFYCQRSQYGRKQIFRSFEFIV